MKLKTYSFPLAMGVFMYFVVPLVLRGSSYLTTLAVASLTIGGIAVAWAMLGNLGGMVSFGHAAFFGVGAYVSSIVALDLGVSAWLSLFVGAFGAMLASIVTMPALRLRGPYFALAILAYAQVFRILTTELEELTGGAGGLLSIPGFGTILGFDFGTKLGAYFLILTIVFLSTSVYALLRKSDHGLALRAMHDSEDATRIVGVPVNLLKAGVLLLSAFITGLVGAFNAHYINFLDPDYAFSGEWTVLPIAAAIFGGYRTVWGPVMGAIVIYMLDQLVFKNLLPHGHHMIFGVLLGAMILLSPDGMVPLIKRRLQRKHDAKA